MPAADSTERAQALDPTTSCIVQAPAGSGKTGLLIQRYLRLLSVAARPEEVLAITFTRKAAAEMRRRVVEALRSAPSGAPADANARLTWTLAREVLVRDGEERWQLVDNPARLRIQTIDSLSAALARQLPVLSRLGATPDIVEDARDLYREAADRTLASLQAGGPATAAIAALLAHLDGDWGQLRFLLETMLARRDLWLSKVLGFEADDRARAVLEGAFRVERARHLRHASGLFPRAIEQDLVRLARHAAENVKALGSASAIARLAGLAGLPAADESGAEDWRALVDLLLKKDPKKPGFRQRLTKDEGFPSGKGFDATVKARMEDLLGSAARVEGLCEALHALRTMPPASYEPGQWRALGAVVGLLPLAAAQLQLVFAERGRIDFTGISRAAVQALGTPEEPTDLLLAMDMRLRHVLVDEFQDTSIGQWQLLERLTAGWEPADGRTIFLVGDPMQSIYRFREAEVGLFLRAWQEGLGAVPLTPLRLATNFRSRAGIVDWVNRHFPGILPAQADVDSGAVPYAPSSAHHAADEEAAVLWHPFLGTDAALAREREAKCVVQLVEQALAGHPGESVAILVRNRSNLDRIVPALRKAKVPFRAVDIEPLGGLQVIQDLLAITRALSHPADRIAWLGVLRAPWCGLTLADLQGLTGGRLERDGARATIWELLHDEARLASLSPEGRERALRVREVLAPFVAQRLRGTLCERVEAAWLALGGPVCAQSAAELDDVDTFLEQLDVLESAGELPDIDVLEQQLERLYGAPDAGEEACVQLMTIHKAKGLEFGTVIVPGMDRVPRVVERPLCLWKLGADGSMMMAPIRPAERREDAAYDYLRSLERAAAQHELERLLYVAVTRTQRRLHLLGYARLQEKDGLHSLRTPPSNCLLGVAWSAAKDEFEDAIPRFIDQIGLVAAQPVIHTKLRRIDWNALLPALPAPGAMGEQLSLEEQPAPFTWAGETARLVGTIAHAWLQRIALDGLQSWDAARLAALSPRVEGELARRGVPPAEVPGAATRIVGVLERALEDERGRWILGQRPEARCEYRIRVATPEGVRLLIIDRMFTEGGQAWIVDYKTSAPPGGDGEAFLEAEKARYFDQMARYAPALRGAPGKLALYFPAFGGWREWPA